MTERASRSLDFPRLYGDAPCQGVIRQQPEDFQVDELAGFEPSGSGEHVCLHIRKRGDNTLWLAKQLARLASVRLSDVGYCGLKDRNAVTSQWFSVWLPGGEEPDWQQLSSPSVTLLQASRHHRKLKRGSHAGNRFRIRITGLNIAPGCTAEDVEVRLNAIRSQGVPNYFGEQRFGHDGGNLRQADAMLTGGRRVKDRHRRGLYLSAARSWLFNQVVAERIRQGCFGSWLEGDRLMINGTSNLSAETDRQKITEQLASLLLHPTAPLYGRGRALVDADSLALEADILAADIGWCEGLERAGLSRERRSVRLNLPDLKWQWPDESTLELSFSLPPGTFATSVLRECCDYRVAAAPGFQED